MRAEQLNIFSAKRMQMNESIELTIQSLLAYCDRYDHWAIAWSGGKDSTTLLTLVLWLIESGQIPRPKSLTIFYADTRLELTPLSIAAYNIIEDLKERGYDIQVVMAPMDDRFMVYMLGVGVPPPSNTFRWCTSQIKIEPMEVALQKLHAERGKVLMLTGVRQGESAKRDERIVISCSKDSAECGQGWFQEDKAITALADTLAPILHWRVCHVWEWLRHWAPLPEYGDWDTEIIADAYGGDEAEEKNARTGCIACPLVQKDTALDNVIKLPKWKYLTPLKRLRVVYRWLRQFQNRIRKNGDEFKKDGSLASNPQRVGPIKLEARLKALDMILEIQREVNEQAVVTSMPLIDIINLEEEARIRELVAAKRWPQGWTGNEIGGEVPIDKLYKDGTVLKDLFGN